MGFEVFYCHDRALTRNLFANVQEDPETSSG